MDESSEKTPRKNSQTSDSPKLLFKAEIDVPKHYSKKNSKVIGYRRVIPKFAGRFSKIAPYLRATKEAANAENFLVLHLRDRARHVGLFEPISIPVRVVFNIQLDNLWTKRKSKREKPRINLRSGDLSNLIQGPEDALQKAGVLSDDALIVQIEARKVSGPNHVQIEIYSVI